MIPSDLNLNKYTFYIFHALFLRLIYAYANIFI